MARKKQNRDEEMDINSPNMGIDEESGEKGGQAGDESPDERGYSGDLDPEKSYSDEDII